MTDTLTVAPTDQAAMEHLRCVVAEAIEDFRVLDTGHEARRLLEAHPDCGMIPSEIAQQLAAMAAAAGVPVRLSPA